MFKKSILKELGKNTGKWASNKLFGDDWSTPYRFSNSNTKLAKDVLQLEEEIEKQQASSTIKMKQLELLLEQSRDYEKKKGEIIAMPIPSDRESLFNFSNFLLSNIYGAGWGSEKEHIHLNAFSNACLAKLNQCRIRLEMINAAFEVKYLGKEIRTLKRKRFFEKFGSLCALFVLMFLSFLGLLVSGAI